MHSVRVRVVSAGLFIVMLLALFYQTSWLGTWIYPLKFEEDIRMNSRMYDVDPYLITAIIRVESNFKEDKLSKKQAVGLMQIMPDTADWIIEQGRFSGMTRDELVNSSLNIEAGSWYLSALNRQYASILQGLDPDSRIAVIAAAYNAGPGNVNKWLKGDVWDGNYEALSDIPFGETRHYIQRVLYYYKKYQELYPEELSA